MDRPNAPLRRTSLIKIGVIEGSSSSSDRGLTDHLTMSRDYLSDERIESEEAFETALAEGIEKAIYGGVDVCGSWEFDIRGSTHHWDVEIFELVRDGDETQK